MLNLNLIERPDRGVNSMRNAQLILKVYQKAVNKLDDYFEYSHDSNKDKARVMAILSSLRNELRKAQ